MFPLHEKDEGKMRMKEVRRRQKYKRNENFENKRNKNETTVTNLRLVGDHRVA